MQLAMVSKAQEGGISANSYFILSIDIERKYSYSEIRNKA